MPFVERDKDRRIIAIYARNQPGKAEEQLTTEDAEIIAFRNRPEPGKKPLPSTLPTPAGASIPALRDELAALTDAVNVLREYVRRE